GPDQETRPQPVAPVSTIDEPKLGQRPQIAVDARDRHLQHGAEPGGPELAAVGDRQQESQAAGERGVFGCLLRRAIASGSHGPIVADRALAPAFGFTNPPNTKLV